MTTPRNSTIALSALAAGVLPLVGNGLYSGPPTTGGQAILDEAASGLPTIAYVAYPLELVGEAIARAKEAGLGRGVGPAGY